MRRHEPIGICRSGIDVGRGSCTHKRSFKLNIIMRSSMQHVGVKPLFCLTSVCSDAFFCGVTLFYQCVASS